MWILETASGLGRNAETIPCGWHDFLVIASAAVELVKFRSNHVDVYLKYTIFA